MAGGQDRLRQLLLLEDVGGTHHIRLEPHRIIITVCQELQQLFTGGVPGGMEARPRPAKDAGSLRRVADGEEHRVSGLSSGRILPDRLLRLLCQGTVLQQGQLFPTGRHISRRPRARSDSRHDQEYGRGTEEQQ